MPANANNLYVQTTLARRAQAVKNAQDAKEQGLPKAQAYWERFIAACDRALQHAPQQPKE